MPEVPKEAKLVHTDKIDCGKDVVTLLIFHYLDKHNLVIELIEGYLQGKTKPKHFATTILYNQEDFYAGDDGPDVEFYINFSSGIQYYSSLRSMLNIYPKGLCSIVNRGKTKI